MQSKKHALRKDNGNAFPGTPLELNRTTTSLICVTACPHNFFLVSLPLKHATGDLWTKWSITE